MYGFGLVYGEQRRQPFVCLRLGQVLREAIRQAVQLEVLQRLGETVNIRTILSELFALLLGLLENRVDWLGFAELDDVVHNDLDAVG